MGRVKNQLIVLWCPTCGYNTINRMIGDQLVCMEHDEDVVIENHNLTHLDFKKLLDKSHEMTIM